MNQRMLLNSAAKFLGVTPHYLRMEAKAGRIPYLKSGNRYLFDIEQVNEYLRNKAIANMNQNTESKIAMTFKERIIGGINK